MPLKYLYITLSFFSWSFRENKLDATKCTYNRTIVIYFKYIVSNWFVLILFNASCEIYSIPKELNYEAVFLSINNETECVPLFFWLWGFTKYARSFILGKLFIEKTSLYLGSKLKQLVISTVLKEWSWTKSFYTYILFLLF